MREKIDFLFTFVVNNFSPSAGNTHSLKSRDPIFADCILHYLERKRPKSGRPEKSAISKAINAEAGETEAVEANMKNVNLETPSPRFSFYEN